MKRNRFLMILAGAVLAGAVVGCGGNKESSSVTNSVSSAGTTSEEASSSPSEETTSSANEETTSSTEPISSVSSETNTSENGLPAGAEEVLYHIESEAVSEPDHLFYWNDQGETGHVIQVNHAYQLDGVYYFSYEETSTTTNADWGCCFQLFYKNSNLTENTNYSVSMTIHSDVAGKIRVNGTEVELVVGDNEVSVDYQEGSGASLAIMMGTYATSATNITAANISISDLSWGEPQGEVLVTSSIGTAVAKISNVKWTDADGQVAASILDSADAETILVMNSDQAAALANPGQLAFWYDQNWCGSSVTASGNIDESGFTADYTTDSGFCWFGVQFFYKSAALNEGSEYTLTMDLNITAGGWITINGEKVKLTEGDNQVEVTYTETAQGVSLNIQMGINVG